jgi:hypothetical protein
MYRMLWRKESGGRGSGAMRKGDAGGDEDGEVRVAMEGWLKR